MPAAAFAKAPPPFRTTGSRQRPPGDTPRLTWYREPFTRENKNQLSNYRRYRLSENRLPFAQNGVLARILIVDDQAVVLNVLLGALNSLGHGCTVARSGQQALEAAQSSPEKIDLLIVDHSLPPDRGRDIAERILQWHPLMKVLHISGYPKSFLGTHDSITPNAGFLEKPFTAQQIRAAVAALLD
jgi:CheY-like chemotaxis protein